MQISDNSEFDLPVDAIAQGQPSPTFGAGGEQLSYFNAASRRTALDMALYLARYSDLVLLIHGPTGSGKTTLMHEMIVRGGPNIHAVTVTADRSLTTQSICDAMLSSFKLVATPSALMQPIVQIKEQLDLLQRKGYHCIVFIDEADRLASDAVPFLEALADLRSDSGRNLLNLVLFTEHREKINLAGPSVRHRVKTTELQPLAADEVGAYVKYFQRSNRSEVGAIAFREREIQRIARASSGWPGNINAMINQRSARDARQPNTVEHLLDRPWATPRYALGATAITAALILVFVYQDSVNHLFVTPPIVPPIVKAPTQIAAPVAVVAAPVDEPMILPTSPDITPPEVIATAPEAATTGPIPLAVPAAAVAVAPEPSATITTNALTTTTKPQRDEWLLAQNPDAYTLQIAGSSQEGDIRRALKKFSLADPAAVFSASRKGKPWFGLVTGVYADFASAQQARTALPDELMRGAWVRRLRAVQNEISKPQEATEASDQATGTATATSQPATAPTQLP